MEEEGGRWFNREGVTGRIRRWLTVTSEGGICTTPARVFFSFFFLFLFFFSLLFRSSGLGGGQVGGWVEEKKKKYLDPVRNTSTALYSIVPLPTSSFFLPNCGLPCRKMHGQLGRRTWNYGSLRLRVPFPYSCCHQANRHDYKSTSFALCPHQEIGDFHFPPPPSTILS